ncbi:glycosyltransferase involved in cell wall biosynthesis [Methanomicrobium sp. W14]|uniref:glycosyltransferase family 4 protein n=1 Tax=Methanomicrobium sp. W14 TaxID=2817839 RepID=UPI001AE86516|nr:glycosyltransferase family 4 protein [Methanomicrobium sp. W14]MBP2133102.1 glycosyltransferase involved in cell wall biosynthesis [Methanomicrobium sp. W14]
MVLSYKNSGLSVIRIVRYFYYFGGGCSNHVKELSEKINPYLKDQIIITSDIDDIDKEFDRECPVPVIRIKSPDIKKRFGIPVTPLNNLLFMINVYRTLEKMERPDIIHAHGICPVAFGSIIGRILNIPVVGMLHGSSEAYSPISGLFESTLAVLFKPDHALILDDGSPAPQKFLKLWGDRVSIVYHGIDTEYYSINSQFNMVRERLGFRASDFLILSTSSLITVKRPDLAIEAFVKFLEIKAIDERRAYLIFAGDGKLKESLMDLVKNNSIMESVKFAGKLKPDEIKDYLSIADAVVGTSVYSNMNRSIQEAMSSGAAVVAFNSGRLDRLIEDGSSGLLVKPGDTSEFADKLYMLYENPELKETLGKNARNTILSERSWDLRIKQELEVYKLLMTELNESGRN